MINHHILVGVDFSIGGVMYGITIAFSEVYFLSLFVVLGTKCEAKKAAR